MGKRRNSIPGSEADLEAQRLMPNEEEKK